jgi:hypothetical protein
MASIERYLEVYDSLRRRKRWSTDSNILRFAALTLAATDMTDPGARLEETAKALAKQAGGFSPLGSGIRHAVAAILIRRGLKPAGVVRRVKETLGAFKEHKLRILDRWDRDHRFLTSTDDYPMAAMHAARDVNIEQLGVDVELIYKALRKAGFSMGNQLQLVSHLLVFSEYGPLEAAQRFVRMASALKKKGQRIWQSQYDEVTLLVLSGGHIGEVTTKVVRYRDRLREFKPRPQASIAFSIAAGIVLNEEAEKVKGLKGAAAAAQLRSVQSLIEAQQAAMIACMGATVAVTAATSGS